MAGREIYVGRNPPVAEDSAGWSVGRPSSSPDLHVLLFQPIYLCQHGEVEETRNIERSLDCCLTGEVGRAWPVPNLRSVVWSKHGGMQTLAGALLP